MSVSISPPVERRRVRSWIPLILLCALGMNSHAAVEVQVFNLSPRAAGSGGEVGIDLGGQASLAALPYRKGSALLTLADAHFIATVRDEGGNVLLSQPLDLADGRRYVLAFAGDGQSRPFEMVYTLQHNQTVQNGFYSLQSAFFATVGAGAESVRLTLGARDCRLGDPPLQPNPEPIARRYTPSPVVQLGFSSALTCTRLTAQAQNANGAVTRTSTEFVPESGERINVFVIGDGVRQPYEQLLVRGGVEPTLPMVTGDRRMEGLWFDPERPGEGLAVLVDTTRVPNRLRLLYYGFNLQNESAWGASIGVTPPSFSIESFVGGSIDGQLPTAATRLDLINLRFHSCSTASFETLRGSDLIRHDAADELRSRRLYKLLPIENCDA